MERWWRLSIATLVLYCLTVTAQGLPYFVNDINNLLPISESTPVGTVVHTLRVHNDDALPVKFGLRYTDKFTVESDSGEIRLAKPLDRETEDTIKFEVYIEEDHAGRNALVQTQPLTVIVLDENDNAPVFKNSPYEVDISEDEAVGSTVLRNIEVEDRDSFGNNLEVGCFTSKQRPDVCQIFEVVSLQSSSNQYKGALVLRAPLNYNDKQFYQFQLYATDGEFNSTAHVEVKVVDVQNSPPVFSSGSLTAMLAEDVAVGTLVLKVKARDGDKANTRSVVFELLSNPMELFVLDRNSGELRTARPLDREALPDPNLPLNITVRASEVVDGVPVVSELTSSTATVTVTVTDVNDEAPRFSRREYAVTVPESLPLGTPLPNLDITVTDLDMGLNSAFRLRLADELGAFVVEPANATGSTPVTIRLNRSLDYEDPNQRKFILEVIAEELYTSQRLSSRASVTVTLRDDNDNAPMFGEGPHDATIAEQAPPGTAVLTLTATDRDSGRFGTEGIVYSISGSGAELFQVQKRTGQITLAPCPTPGQKPCLDFEERKDYFLQLTATDNDGEGQSMVVPVHITVLDGNDNPPVFVTQLYKASLDEDAVKFEPELQVQARDLDVTSELRYMIISPPRHPFTIDPLTGRIGVNTDPNVESPEVHGNKITLVVLATDGLYNATCTVEITIRDVNDHAPQFDSAKYDADVTEDAPVGTQVAAVRATDMDSGENAEIKYSIQKGGYDAFAIDAVKGVVTVAAPLDYDKKSTYNIQIIASDSGMPSLTGTAELTVHISDVNDKPPHLTPPTQRAQVSAGSPPGTVVHQLTAVDSDAIDKTAIHFELDTNRTIKAVTVNGLEVSEEGIFGGWFMVHGNGTVTVSAALDRARATVITLPLVVTDTSAQRPQKGYGELIITIVAMNDHAPAFSQPAYYEKMEEEQPIGTVLGTYTASDPDGPIATITISPPSPYFTVDNITGVVKTAQRIDYEKFHEISFTLVAIDAGLPSRSGTAAVTVHVVNVNDEEPVFDQLAYEANVTEHVAPLTDVLTVHAVDKDDDEYGIVRYSLSGELAGLFTIDPASGEVAVAPGADIDREAVPDVWLRATATDFAPPHLARSNSVPIHIKVLDINDNSPVFGQKVYITTIAENLQLQPPAAILQVTAEDKDEGLNGEVAYSIIEQSEPGTFKIDPQSGIIYPAGEVVGNRTYELVVEARDGAGDGPHRDNAGVIVSVTSVNRHSPIFVRPPQDVRQIEIPEAADGITGPWLRLVLGPPALRRLTRSSQSQTFPYYQVANAAQADYLITKFEATDEDRGDNGQVSYFLKVDNRNVGETSEFRLDSETGELRTKTFLDRELRPEYELVIAAVDHGKPAHERLRVMTVVLQDEDDNLPSFSAPRYTFSISENLPPNVIVGTVKAEDKDAGENAQVYYHILEGNDDGAFTISKTSGVIKANVSFDREQKSEYIMTVYASNNPLLDRAAAALNDLDNGTEPRHDVTTVIVTVLDENDNAPKFESSVYYAGVKYNALVNSPIISVSASDPDLAENGTLIYMVAASNLYKFGDSKPSGSVVPSPFNITQDGLVMTATYMSEYNQDRFVLDILAQETAPPHRHARTQLYIWIIDSSSLIRMVRSRGCGPPRAPPPPRLAAAARALLVTAQTLPHVHADRRYDHWCEIHLHAVDPTTYQVLPVEKVLETIDSKYDELKDLYQEYGVETLIALSATTKAPDAFDPALATLIALLIVLFTGIVTFVVVCACLRHWVISPGSLQSSKGDSVGRRRILEELSTTENPLWLETKLRPYEEQELTMNVFGDQQDALVEPAPIDNTYATIQGRGGGGGGGERFGEYATLGGESPTALEAALGFQGSTFKPPPAPDTPEPPPRPSVGLAHIWNGSSSGFYMSPLQHGLPSRGGVAPR